MFGNTVVPLQKAFKVMTINACTCVIFLKAGAHIVVFTPLNYTT